MGRLIDVDNFLERMENDTDLCAEMEKDGLKALKKYLDMQPTVYDVDKVVQQLGKKKQTHEHVAEYEKRKGTITEEFQQRKAVEVLEDAIEIVKGEAN